MASHDSRTVLEVQDLAQAAYVICQRTHRKLRGSHVVAVGLQAFDDLAPTGAVGPRAVDKNDIRQITHFGWSFLFL